MDILVDSADEPLLASRKWRPYRYGRRLYYATSYERGRTLYLHREIIAANDGEVVDHINGNGLDNRRCNLRLVTHSENHANAPLNVRNASGCKGVSWDKRDSKWFAKITVRKKQIALGRYERLCDASDAYDVAARMYYGDSALTNAMMRARLPHLTYEEVN